MICDMCNFKLCQKKNGCIKQVKMKYMQWYILVHC